MKSAIQGVFHRFGYHVRRTDSRDEPAVDPFTVQKELISAREPVIFDIGAHVGEVTRTYRGLFPQATIHSFEPFPDSFEALSKSTEQDSRILSHRIAMADKSGTATFNANVSPSTSSLLPTDQRGSSYFGEGLFDTVSQIEVATTTVDDFCHEQGISHIDIMKMDVQGAEFSVLRGATDMLERGAVSLIYTELIMVPNYVGQHRLHEYLSFLDMYGYELLDFFNPYRRDHKLIESDVIFVGPDLRS